MRNGFSLITAIIFIVLVATLGALSLSLSTLTTKQTSDLYLKEQAELLARSGTEFALLAISGHEINSTTGCLNQINAQYPNTTNPIFDINISIQYLGSNLPAGCDQLGGDISTADSNLTVLVDTIVTTSTDITTEPIRFHRRTLQKP